MVSDEVSHETFWLITQLISAEQSCEVIESLVSEWAGKDFLHMAWITLSIQTHVLIKAILCVVFMFTVIIISNIWIRKVTHGFHAQKMQKTIMKLRTN